MGKLKAKYGPQIKDLRLTFFLIRKTPLTVLGILIMMGFVVATIVGQYIVPYPEDALGTAMNPLGRFQPPSLAHFFGTDEMGRDVFSRVVFGARFSLQVAATVILIGLTIGTLAGLVAGYIGGRIEGIIMRFTDVFLSIPSLVLAILVASVVGSGLVNCAIAMSVTAWTRYCRLIRGQVISLKSQTYVEAARMVGAGTPRIIFRHILPNCLSVLLVQVSLDMGAVILLAAALGFLGLGASPPTPEWGLMISQGRSFMPDWWWVATFPGLAIALVCLAFNLVGDGLRDVLDPRMRRGR